ncbi:hypothetical protein UNH65_17135 [Chitinophaga sp. 180180018-2]|nr:hypothetical protein [Chitinophaga sp. 212800010-3]
MFKESSKIVYKPMKSLILSFKLILYFSFFKKILYYKRTK